MNEKMKILFVSADFPPMDGGIAIFDYHICKELVARGHKLIVIAKWFQGCKDFDNKQDFVIFRLKGKIRPTSLESIYKILITILKKKIELIFFGHFGSTHWLGGVLAKKIFKVPYIIFVHGNEFNAYLHKLTKADRWASKIVLKNTTQIITNSRATKKVIENNGFPSKRIHIVYPGADPEIFNANNQNIEIMKKYELEGKKVLLSVSRLAWIKNHVNVLNALPKVIKHFPNLIYLIVGKGEEEKNIRIVINELGLQSYVKLIGYIEPPHVGPYYCTCDVFIMPSKSGNTYYESFGIAYAEANACGKPVIAGKSGGIEEAVIDGVTGLLVDPENIEEIAQTIIRLLTDREYARKLGENGRRRVENELNWKTTGKKIEEVLVKLLKE